MNNRRYCILAGGNVIWATNLRDAEHIYNSYTHARMEVWENRNDHNSARFIKKK